MKSTTQSRTLDTFEAIKDDLVTSWYFKLWLLLWIVGGAVIFAALVMFAEDHIYISPSDRLHSSLHNASQIEFPRWQFRYGDTFGSDANKLVDVQCFHNDVPTPVGGCNGASVLDGHCLEVGADKWNAYNSYSLSVKNRRIDCEVVTQTTDLLPPESLLFDIQGQHWGQESMTTQQIRESEGAFIMLQKSEYQTDGVTHTVDWEPSLTYYLPQVVEDHYRVRVQFADFRVFVFNEVSNVNIVAWENCAWIGGFALFVWILHRICMFFAGFFLDNNSLVLKGNLFSQPYTDYTGYTSNEPARKAGDGFEGAVTSADL